jgi:hypothetical protein
MRPASAPMGNPPRDPDRPVAQCGPLVSAFASTWTATAKTFSDMRARSVQKESSRGGGTSRTGRAGAPIGSRSRTRPRQRPCARWSADRRAAKQERPTPLLRAGVCCATPPFDLRAYPKPWPALAAPLDYFRGLASPCNRLRTADNRRAWHAIASLACYS